MKPRGTHPAAYGQRMWQQYYSKRILKRESLGIRGIRWRIGGSGRLQAILFLLGEHNEVFWSSWGSGVAYLQVPRE